MAYYDIAIQEQVQGNKAHLSMESILLDKRDVRRVAKHVFMLRRNKKEDVNAYRDSIRPIENPAYRDSNRLVECRYLSG